MSIVDNERTKLLANNIDRASTACFVVGLIQPVSAGLAHIFETSVPYSAILSLLAALMWFSLGITLHLIARRVLGKLQ